MDDGFYTSQQLQSMGFSKIGKNVQISRKTSIYGVENITIGDNVRIDDFVILSGKIEIGSFVHIGASSNLTGSEQGIFIKDFCGISSHVRIFAITDDYTGEAMTNSCVPMLYKQITTKPIILEKHCIIGSGSLLLPDAYLAEGVAVGSMSLIVRKTTPWGVYFGIPAKRIKNRKTNPLKLEQELLKQLGGGAE